MFTFAWPYIFLLLPLPWLAWRYFPRAENRQYIALKVPFFSRMQNLTMTTRLKLVPQINNLQLLSLGVWALLITALAGPQWLGKPVSISQTGRDVMLAIDLSGSMEIPDLILDGKYASRLAIVKRIADPFIQQRVGDRIGIVVFGTRAYLQAPLTFDRQTLRKMMDDTSIGLAGPQTAIGDALGLSIKRLLNSPAQSRAIILLTDGGNNTGIIAPMDAANVAAQNHIKIYTIGIGADTMEVRDMFGTRTINPSNDLDLDTLKKIADLTGAKFYRAKTGDELRDIYHDIDQLEPAASDTTVVRSVKHLYPWPLALALLLSVMLVMKHVLSSSRALAKRGSKVYQFLKRKNLGFPASLHSAENDKGN